MSTLPTNQTGTVGDERLHLKSLAVKLPSPFAAAVRRLPATLAVAVLLAGCAGQKTPIPDAPSLAARVYTARCSVCHSLPSPKRLYYSQWKHMIRVMNTNMTHRGMQPLSPEDKREILAYLKANAR